MQNYIDLLKDITENGVDKGDRTGVGTRAVFGRSMRWNLSDGFPIITTRKVSFRIAFEETMFFLRGESDTTKLEDKKIKIWSGNTTREFLDNRGLTNLPVGNMGRGYGVQWRDWRTTEILSAEDSVTLNDGSKIWNGAEVHSKSTDQLVELIEGLKRDPNGRRHIITAWNPGELNLMALPPCFPKNAYTFTKNGYVPIDTISVGDEVLGDDGMWDVVYDTFKTPYKGELIELNIRYYSDKLLQTPNHPFLVKDRGYVHASDISDNDSIALVKYKSANIIPEFTIIVDKHCKFIETNKLKLLEVSPDFSKRTYKLTLTEDDMFTLGYFMGDGWYMPNSNYRVCFAISDKDVLEILPKIRKTIKVSIKNNKNTATNKVSTYETKSFLWSHVLKQFGHKAHNKKIPLFVFNSPENYRRAFLDGYYAADGNARTHHTHLKEFVTTSKELAYGIQVLGSSLNQFYSINESARSTNCIIQGREVNQRNFYSVKQIDLNNNRYLSYDDNYFWVKVKSITKTILDDDFVYNFSTTRTHSYTINNLVTHNCHITHQYIVNDGRLDSSWLQRSVDSVFGLPYNIMSYAFMNVAFAKLLGLEPGELVFFGNDVHIYNNQLPMAIEQITRIPRPLPKITITKELNTLDDLLSLEFSDIVIEGYDPYPDFKDKPPMAV